MDYASFVQISSIPPSVIWLIVETGDLSRFFAPPVILDSVQVNTIEHTDKVGRLKEMKLDESQIPPESRVSRLTNAMWNYGDTGATGSLLHGMVLHGQLAILTILFWNL